MNRRVAYAAIAAISLALTPLTMDVTLAKSRAKKKAALEREATTLYAEARYAEARSILEQLDGEGALSGTMLYRLAYCQRTGGDWTAGAETERRAVEALEGELPDATAVEVPFYLANAYQNTGRESDARRVAADATARFERGELARPEAGAAMFQLGKLYADQGESDHAERWYAQAVDAMEKEGRPSGSYVRRASRYLAGNAFERRDFTAAQRYFTVLLETGEATAADLDRLATACAHVGLYAEASAAWDRAGRLNPEAATSARYRSGLASMAARAPSLAATAPSGKPWAELSKQELETLMKEQSERVKSIRAEAEQLESIDKPARQAYRKRLEEIRGIFLPAAMEYVLRGFSIRETAFFGGYAPLVLKPSAWRPPKKKGAAATE